MDFQPDYRHFEKVMNNERPMRLPIYEHIISPGVMEKIMDKAFVHLAGGDGKDQEEYFRNYCAFFKDMTYDVITFEVSSRAAGPGPHALSGGVGPIQSRSDFEKYPWDDMPRRFWEHARGQFDALVKVLPEGMKLVGGIGNGVFENAEDLVGLEHLPFMQVDEPELYAELFVRIGDYLCILWQELLDNYQGAFVACRFGDDLGFKSSLLTNPRTVRDHILPQYKRVIDIVHEAGKPFLFHSCGCLFEVMEDIIDVGIDAKHSNEDAIAPFDRWIADYGSRIGLAGGFDMDFLCQKSADEVYAAVIEHGTRYRDTAQGYALGSGNSIPDYVPAENYLAMVRAAQAIRANDGSRI
ncbi:MAG: hypothetical protein JW808_10515 [Victivallales bacterium]|nr:hypothetical protein [Victivallales bacterium]